MASTDGTRPPLRVGVVGSGFFSRFHYDAWRRIPEVSIAGIASLDRPSAEAIAAELGGPPIFADIAAMLDAVRPDILDVAAPPPAHLPAIRAAAARGVFVICQKPFCGSLGDAETAIGIARQAGTGLVVHENFRFQPWYQEIKRILDTGGLGRVWQVTYRLRTGDGQGPDAYLSRQPYFQTMPRLLVHETAIHLIDVFRFLLGDVRAVYADLRRLNPVIAGEDAGFIVLDCANDVRAVFDGNRLLDHPARDRRLTLGEMMVEGEAGSLRLDGDGRLWHRRFGEDLETPHAYDWHDLGPGGDSVWRLQRHVVDHILHGGPVSNTGEDYLANLRIEEAVYASSAAGRRIDL